MADWKGFRSIIAFKKAATWGTAVAAGAGSGWTLLSDAIKPDAQFIENQEISGSPFQRFGDKGNEFHRGEVPMDFDYEWAQRVLAYAVGTAGVPVQQGLDLAYKHVLKVANVLDGIFGTLVIGNADLFVREYTTAKLNGFTLSCEPNGRLKLTPKFIGHKLNNNTTTGTNTTTTLGTVTRPAASSFATFNQLVLRANDQGGGALGSGDRIFISNFTLDLARNLKEDDVTTENVPYVDEPKEDGFCKVTGSFRLSRLQGLTRIVEFLAKTPRKKMDVVWTGPIVAGATNYKLTLYLNDVQYTNLDGFTVDGPGLVTEDLTFEAHVVDVVPTGFPATYTGAVTIEVINGQSADPLTV